MFLDFFFKYLFSKRAGALVKKISWLSMIGLTVSLAALILVISVMIALNRNIEERTLAVDPHLTIQIPGINSATLLELHPLVAKLRADENLRVNVFEQQDVILRTMDGHFRGAVARGLTQGSLDRLLTEMQKLKQKKYACRKETASQYRDSCSAGGHLRNGFGHRSRSFRRRFFNGGSARISSASANRGS